MFVSFDLCTGLDVYALLRGGIQGCLRCVTKGACLYATFWKGRVVVKL